ncbi:MAG: H-X9-DG-CTERM domain-containing protein, partial [Victivallales bacterium]
PWPYAADTKLTWMLEILKSQNVQFKNRDNSFYCPSIKTGSCYGMNNGFMLNTSIPKKNKILLLSDSVHYMPGDYPQKPSYGGAAYKIQSRFEHPGTGTADRKRHMGGANVLFSDGSVDWLPSNLISTNPTDPLWFSP